MHGNRCRAQDDVDKPSMRRTGRAGPRAEVDSGRRQLGSEALACRRKQLREFSESSTTAQTLPPVPPFPPAGPPAVWLWECHTVSTGCTSHACSPCLFHAVRACSCAHFRYAGQGLTFRHELLAPEGNTAVAAVPRLHEDFGGVEAPHLRRQPLALALADTALQHDRWASGSTS